MRFDWDRDKEAVNVAKHGVDFSEAQSAFADPLLVLAADKGHKSKGAAPFLHWPGARAAALIRDVPIALPLPSRT